MNQEKVDAITKELGQLDDKEKEEMEAVRVRQHNHRKDYYAAQAEERKAVGKKHRERMRELEKELRAAIRE